MSLCTSSPAQQPEAAGPPGHRGEQVHLHPHLCLEDDQPAAPGSEQQPPDRPAAGHGQVGGDVVPPGCGQRRCSFRFTCKWNACLQAGAARHPVRPQEQLLLPPCVSHQHLHPEGGGGQRRRAHLRSHQTVQQPGHQVHEHRTLRPAQAFTGPFSRLLMSPQVHPSVRQLVRWKEEEEEEGGGEEEEGEDEKMEGAGGGEEGQQREGVHGGVRQLAEGQRWDSDRAAPNSVSNIIYTFFTCPKPDTVPFSTTKVSISCLLWGGGRGRPDCVRVTQRW